jgi:hypothetical protein
MFPAVQAVVLGGGENAPMPLRRARLEATLLLERHLHYVLGVQGILVHELVRPRVSRGGAAYFFICGGSGARDGGFGHVRVHTELWDPRDNVFEIDSLMWDRHNLGVAAARKAKAARKEGRKLGDA